MVPDHEFDPFIDDIAGELKGPIIIRGEADMGYRFLEPVLITCAEADVKNVNFNTKKVEQKVSAPADAG